MRRLTQTVYCIYLVNDLSWNLLEYSACQPVFCLWGLELMIILSGIKNPSRNVLFQIFNIIESSLLFNFNDRALFTYPQTGQCPWKPACRRS